MNRSESDRSPQGSLPEKSPGNRPVVKPTDPLESRPERLPAEKKGPLPSSVDSTHQFPETRGRTLRTWSPALLLGMLGILTSILAFLLLDMVESRAIEAEFREINQESLTKFQEALRWSEADLKALANYLSVNGHGNEQVFRQLSTELLQRHVALRALDWRPRVADHQRLEFERSQRREGAEKYRIQQFNDQLELIAAQDRTEFFPIQFITPHDEYALLLGFDLNSDSARWEALAHSRDTGRPAVTPPLHLPHDPHGPLGVLLIVPVYQEDSPPATAKERAAALLGFYVGVLQPTPLLHDAYTGFRRAGLSVALFDGPSGQMIAHRTSGESSDEPFPYSDLASVPPGLPRVTNEIAWANRTWNLSAIAGPEYIRQQRSNWPWVISLGGIVMTLISTVMIQHSSRQSRQLARLNEGLSNANQQLFHREQDLTVTLKSLGDGVIATDVDLRITRLNPAAEELTGWTQGEALGKHLEEVFQVVDESTRHPFTRPIAAVLEPNTPSGLTHQSILVSRNGPERTISENATPIRDEQGRFIGIVLVFRDITEERRVQRQVRHLNEKLEDMVARRTAELEASEQRFRRTFEGAATGIAVTDAAGQFVEANAAYCQMLGYSEAELLSRNITCVTHPDYTPGIVGIYEELLRGIRDHGVLEKRCRDKLGATVWCRTSISALRDRADNTRHIVVVAQDITQQRAAEEELRKSESLLQIASRVGRMGAWNLRLDQNEIEWSEEARLIHELEATEVPNLEDLLSFYLPEHQKVVREAMENCLRKGTSFDLELRMRTAKGRKRWVRLIGEAVRDAEGAIKRIQGAIQDIDERKETEITLAASETRFRQLAEAMPVIVWTATPEGVVDYANRQFYEYTKLSAETPLDPTWQKFLHPEDLEECRRLWSESYLERRPFSMKYRIHSADRNRYEWFHVQAVPIYDSRGQLTKWFGTTANVHEIVQLQQQATDLAARLTTTLESITDAFFTLDPDWRFDYVNLEAERLLNRSREELRGNSLWDEFPEAVGSDFERFYQQAVEEGKAVTFEAYYGPLEKWFEVHAYPSSEGLAIYFRDVTQQLEAERLIRENEERFRLLAKASDDAIRDWNISTDLLWWNEGFESLFGFCRDEVEPSLDCWTNRIHPDDQARVLQSLRETLESKGESFHCDYRFLHKEGHYRYVSDRGHIIRDSEGKPLRMIGGMTDLTERRHLEEQLLQSQKMEAVGQLAGGIAHDFNNLLTIITGYSELLLTTWPTDSPERPMLLEIHEASERAANLTRQLLAFSRKQVLAPQVVDLNAVVAKMERLLRRLIPEDIQLITQLAPLRHRILVDPGQLEQVVINLVVNARDAMPSGGILKLESRDVEWGEYDSERQDHCPSGSHVLFTVSDNGCGMSAEVREHIFEPFYTTKEPTKGTGLGLATVFGIVKQSGGSIEVESEPGRGTRFQIYFPAVACEVSPEVPPEKEVEMGRATILLVEDDEGVRRLARLALETFGYRVFEAAQGREALELLRSGSPTIQLVITDVVMPEMNGRELVEELRKQCQQTKVLFMSGYTDDAVVRNGVLEAAEFFLQKPFTPTTLARKVHEILGTSS